MKSPISVRLDDTDQATLEAEARQRGIGLSTYLRELAAGEAIRLRRARIREQSRLVGEHVATSPVAQEFYADWGTPSAVDGER
jgi:hypothetical protein